MPIAVPASCHHGQRRRSRPASIALALVATASALAADPSSTGPQRQRGRQLFSGEVSLQARLAGHDDELPTIASRCMNCHETIDRPPNVGDIASDDVAPETYAATLSSETLSKPRVRRGGPASVFDVASFCALLRTGIDPASIIISTTMPRYQISDAQCTDLWTYLQSR